MTPKKILLSAGGTGGHLFPAEALATELIARGHKVVIFTDKRGEAFKSLGPETEIHTIPAATIKPGILSKIRALFTMGAGCMMAMVKILRLRPDIIVGFGGYPSFPGVFAGQILGCKTIIHEQNAVLGKANMALRHLARHIAQSLPGTRGLAKSDIAKSTVTGNPVRKAIISISATPYAPPQDNGDIIVLITGGSQAASLFSDIVPAGMALLPEEKRKRLRIMHQCRQVDLARTTEAYKTHGIRAETAPFFADIADRLRDCHLFIGRSGAGTVAEIAVAGRPAIFVPLRHADMQQLHNAEVLSAKNGAWIMNQENFTAEALADRMATLIDRPEILSQTARSAQSCGRPDSATALADLVEKQLTG